MELLTTLGIDWKLLLAQLINFGLLIAALTYLVYKPILRVLDQRRERIRKSMDDASFIERQRKEIEEFRKEQLKKVDQETGEFLKQAKIQAESVRKDILENAQREADQLLQKARKQMEEERAKIAGEVRASLGGVVVRLAEKVLEREFSHEDQNRILQNLAKSLPSLVR